jgi:hypothetical protein
MTAADADMTTVRVTLNYSATADGYAELWSPVIRPAAADCSKPCRGMGPDGSSMSARARAR